MKWTVLHFVTLGLLSLSVEAKELTSFNEMGKWVNAGNKVVFLIDMTKCDIDEKKSTFKPFHKVLLNPEQITFWEKEIVTHQSAIHTYETRWNGIEPLYEYYKFFVRMKEESAIGFYEFTQTNASSGVVHRTYTASCILGDGFKAFTNSDLTELQ